MSQINDSIAAGTPPGQLNDGLSAFYAASGYTGALQDQERKWLIPLAGGIPAIATNQDMWFKGLRGLGYTGTLSDMKAAWWAAQTP